MPQPFHYHSSIDEHAFNAFCSIFLTCKVKMRLRRKFETPLNRGLGTAKKLAEITSPKLRASYTSTPFSGNLSIVHLKTSTVPSEPFSLNSPFCMTTLIAQSRLKPPQVQYVSHEDSGYRPYLIRISLDDQNLDFDRSRAVLESRTRS